MTGRRVRLQVADGIATITLDRPEAANALDSQLLQELFEVTEGVGADPDVRVVVVTGAGRHFCAGADLRETPAQRRDSRRAWGAAIDFSRLPQPAIAAINGPALGGGCELALTCEFRFLADSATIGLPEIQFGALPRGGGTARLPRLVGLGPARRMILTGQPVDAVRALEIGLSDQTVPAAELAVTVRAFAAELAALAPYATRAGKRLLNESSDVDLATALAREREVVRTMADRGQRAAARAQAAATRPTYARIFGGADTATVPGHPPTQAAP